VFADRRARLMRRASTGGAFAAPGTRPFAVDLAERGAVVAVKADDVRFVREALRRDPPRMLRDRLDLDRVAAVGHSFGGGAAAVVCGDDAAGFRAGIALDGGLWRAPEDVGVDTPFLQLFGTHLEYTLPCDEVVRRGLVRTAAYCAEDRATTVAAWEALHASGRPGLSVQVRGAGHAGFFDAPLLPLQRWSPLRRLVGTAGPAGWRAATDVVLAFLDRHLRAARAPLIDRLAEDPRFVTGSPATLFAPV
jgi:hypothetical protein